MKINKVYIKHNGYARVIEFLNKAQYDEASNTGGAYRNDLLQGNNGGARKLTYKPPAFIKFKRLSTGKIIYEIDAELLKETINFGKENYEVKGLKTSE